MQHGGVTQDSMQRLSERIYRTGRLGSAALKMATSVQANSSACVSAFHRSLKRRPGGNFSPDKMMRFELLKNALHISHTTRLQISPTPSQPRVDEPTPRQPSLRSAWPSAFLGSAPPPFISFRLCDGCQSAWLAFYCYTISPFHLAPRPLLPICI